METNQQIRSTGPIRARCTTVVQLPATCSYCTTDLGLYYTTRCTTCCTYNFAQVCPESSCFFSRTKKQKYCWWSSYHNSLAESSVVPSGTHCTIAEVAELFMDGWQPSLKALRLEMRMPKIPEEVERFLQTISSIEIQGTLSFPVSNRPVRRYNVRSNDRHQGRKHHNQIRQWLDHHLTTFADTQESDAGLPRRAHRAQCDAQQPRTLDKERTRYIGAISAANHPTESFHGDQYSHTINAEVGSCNSVRCEHDLSAYELSGHESSLQTMSLTQHIEGANVDPTLPSYEQVELWKGRMHPDTRQNPAASGKRRIGRPSLNLTEEQRRHRHNAIQQESRKRRELSKQEGLQVRFHALSVLVEQRPV